MPYLIEDIAGELLNACANEERFRAAAAELYSLCSSITGLNEGSTASEDSESATLPSGQAIAPLDAARCVLDHERTAKFVRGIHAAIRAAQRKFPHGAIELVYAGCGPFAPLVLPLTALFDASQIQFTLLDVHEKSLQAAQKIFDALGLPRFVRQYVRGDAASYKHAGPPVHIVVVEAMQAALEKEPQVAMTMNLAPQISAGGFLVPQKIAIDACLCNAQEEFADGPVAGFGSVSCNAGRNRIHLGRVLELTAESGRELFNKRSLAVPNGLAGGYNLMLLTSIEVFDSITIDESRSGLTCPRILFDLGLLREGMTVEMSYEVGVRPGLKCELS